MIIHAFLFFNEFDLLESKLEYLYDHVDYFVISESNYTFSGNPKPLWYLQEQVRYKKYADKIIYRPFLIEDLSKYRREDGSLDFHAIEVDHRNDLITPLEKFSDDDIVIVSDLDEIPNIEFIPRLKNDLENSICARMNADTFYYDLKTRQILEPKYPPWNCVCAVKLKVARQYGLQWARREAPDIGYWRSAWHLSYFMSPELIKLKMLSFAHAGDVNEWYSNQERIRKAMEDGTDVYGRPIEMEKVGKDYFPEHFFKVFGKYYPE